MPEDGFLAFPKKENPKKKVIFRPNSTRYPTTQKSDRKGAKRRQKKAESPVRGGKEVGPGPLFRPFRQFLKSRKKVDFSGDFRIRRNPSLARS